MRKSRFTEEQITDALWLADTGKKRVYRLPGGSVTAHESQTHAHKHCYSAGLRYSPARTNIGALDFFTTRCSTDERFASSRSLISEVARVGLEANFRLSGRCVGQALDRLAAQREWPNVISWTTAWSSRPRSWSSGQRQGVKLDHTPPGKLP